MPPVTNIVYQRNLRTVAKEAQSNEHVQIAPKRGRSRKAANLAELQRYFTAAAEAASEVLHEGDSASNNREDLTKIAEAGIKPLDSPRYAIFTVSSLECSHLAAWLPSVLPVAIYDFVIGFVRSLRRRGAWRVRYILEHRSTGQSQTQMCAINHYQASFQYFI